MSFGQLILSCCNKSFGSQSKYDPPSTIIHEQQYAYSNRFSRNQYRRLDHHNFGCSHPVLDSLRFFIGGWHERHASLHVEYVKDAGRNYVRQTELEVPANSPYLVTINIKPKSAVHLETPRIWVTFPKSVRIIVDFLQEYPQADKNFPLGELNAERNCLLNTEKPPTYDNLCFPKQPTMLERHLAFYDPSKLNTTLQAGGDYYLWIWVKTGQPIKSEIQIEVAPSNMTKKFIGKLAFSVIETKH